MYCIRCGNKINDNAKYCSECGEQVVSKVADVKIIDADDATIDNVSEELFDISETVTDDMFEYDSVKRTRTKRNKKRILLGFGVYLSVCFVAVLFVLSAGEVTILGNWSYSGGDKLDIRSEYKDGDFIETGKDVGMKNLIFHEDGMCIFNGAYVDYSLNGNVVTIKSYLETKTYNIEISKLKLMLVDANNRTFIYTKTEAYEFINSEGAVVLCVLFPFIIFFVLLICANIYDKKRVK